MPANKNCTDIENERKNCRFNSLELTHFVDGGEEKTRLRKKIENLFFSDPTFIDPVPPEFLSHEDRCSNELRKACAVVAKIRDDPELQEFAGEMEGIRQIIGSGIGNALMKDGNPLTVHYVMFLPAIMGQGTIDQQAYWMGRAWNGEVIGTYAQTELGHGTFLRGLETTAIYDPVAEEFVLDCPTITSMKWWPGGLGKTANYAIVMAQLYTLGKCYGPHPFIVQIRDESTHESMPGVLVGEIGPKLGMNTTDNGFLKLEKVRIPRMYMLMRHAQVLKDGIYIRPASEKLTYGTMLFVRVAICYDVCRQLQRAVTIATRYSVVRRQSELVPGEEEPKILEFQTQQYKVIPNIATVFAILISARSLWGMHSETVGSVEQANLDLLPELHMLSCGLKALCSQDCTEGVETCRLSCGGHGYMASSNFPRIYTATTAAITYEGENTVMWLQVARYLMKCVRDARRGYDLKSTVSYMNANFKRNFYSGNLSNDGLIAAWESSLRHMVFEAADRLEFLCKNGKRFEHAWNECSIFLAKCAEYHMRYFVCKEFIAEVNSSLMSASTKEIIRILCRLYIIYQISRYPGIFLRSNSLTSKDISTLESEMYELLSVLRHDAVCIVDAFDIDDRILDSAIGAYDGDVYQRMFDAACKSPLNQKDVLPSYDKYLRPLLKSHL